METPITKLCSSRVNTWEQALQTVTRAKSYTAVILLLLIPECSGSCLPNMLSLLSIFLILLLQTQVSLYP